MDKNLKEVLENRDPNYILPFFWQHGESDERLLDELRAIEGANCRAVCVESRPHEGFGGAEWFEDFDLIMDYCRQHDMQVWLLDDKHFPTGYANNAIAEKYPELGRRELTQEHIDVTGPLPGGQLLMKHRFLGREVQLRAVIAAKRESPEEVFTGEVIDLTDRIRGDFLYWDIPEGTWRVFLLGVAEGAKRVDFLRPESVDVLISEVYEPHYRRYKDDFGKTFAGFFSDEPNFWLTHRGYGPYFRQDPYKYSSTLGDPYLDQPWNEGLLETMEKELGEPALPLLPALWYDLGECTSRVRIAFMNAVTRAYRDNFSMRLGEWCRARGVDYIGHVIEDSGAHTRLGVSAGHFFRALDGQTMSGIDVVLHQIVPGFNASLHAGDTGGVAAHDGRFFDYALAKLAASQAHLNPRMRGRAMCEIFGAYGWAEGMPLSKYLCDHLLVRGINRFVPHAFDDKYPDPDCPPHFYACGDNPQYRDFGLLMRYLNRAAHLLEGTHCADAAILYHAEGEWSGRDFAPFQDAARQLYDRQIDFDVLPEDYLDAAEVRDGRLCINGMAFAVVFVPYIRVIPRAIADRLSAIADQGASVAYVDAFPESYAEGGAFERGKTITVPAAMLADYMQDRELMDVRMLRPFPYLRVYHCVRGGTHTYMFTNEDAHRTFDRGVWLPFAGQALALDLLGDATETVTLERTPWWVPNLPLTLVPGESRFIVIGETTDHLPPKAQSWTELAPVWQVSLAEERGYTEFAPYRAMETLVSLTGPDEKPDFSGIARYEAVFDAPEGGSVLDLGRVGETARVTLNGEALGARICAPYTFDVRGKLLKTGNRLTVEVADTLVYRTPDPFSKFLARPPSGLLGPVRLGKE